MDTREFKGLELAARAKIEFRKTYWYVPSGTETGGYRVGPDAADCSCDDFELRRQPCKHIFAVRFVKERNRGKPLPGTDAATEPPKPRPTYRQDWPAYNAAQTSEKRLFLPLLADLCGTVPEPPRTPGRGRKPVPLKDGLFAAIYKTYSGYSSRRFASDLAAAGDAGLVSKVPHYNFVFKLLEDEATTPILRTLVTRSSLPLRAVETRFAVDSSGFSTSKFERWFDAKYGVERRRSTWVKTHLCVGVDTHVVVAAEVGDAHDSKMFAPLVSTAADNFPLCEVSADKAYLSNDNLELVDDLGAKPFIPFKANSTPGAPGSVWNRLYHRFALARDEFLAHYHQRSNVESAFSMVKRKFGDALRSKTPTAMANEVLAKLVCHNVVCCIHEAHERGIDVGFGPKPEPEPRVLRFPGA